MKIAATSGCFDLVHVGHVWLFQEMRKAADLVVVFVNSDDYLLRVKGRSIIPLDQRLGVLLALRDVDIVIPFHQNDPVQMIECLQPDLWFKGSEYEGVEIPETPVVESYGGKMVFVRGGPSAHTIDILRRIRDAQS